jgi:hypothetical protein
MPWMEKGTFGNALQERGAGAADFPARVVLSSETTGHPLTMFCAEHYNCRTGNAVTAVTCVTKAEPRFGPPSLSGTQEPRGR